MVDGQHVVKANFSPSDDFKTHAVLRSPSFPGVPYYHSLYHSALFHSCLVSRRETLVALLPALVCDLLFIKLSLCVDPILVPDQHSVDRLERSLRSRVVSLVQATYFL